MIDSGAEGCGAFTCAGWASLSAVWTVFGAEGVSQVYDKGAAAGGGNMALAGIEVVTLGQGGKVTAGAKALLRFVGQASRFNQLTHAAAGIAPYSAQSAITAGHRGAIQAHHLIEQRFADVMGGATKDWAAIVVTREEHNVFTAAWREAIPRGEGTRNATRAQVEAEARKIYADYPEILNALGLK